MPDEPGSADAGTDDATIITGEAEAEAAKTEKAAAEALKAAEAKPGDAEAEKAAAEKAKVDEAEAGKKADEAKEGKDAKKEGDEPEGAPAEYADFKMPEGMTVDPDALATFAPLAKRLDLTQDEAQELVNLQAEAVVKHAKAQEETWAKTQSEWRSASKADKEIGGDNFDANVALAKKALDKVGTKELRDLLDVTGTGNHLEVIRFFSRVGTLIGEDTLNFGNAPGEGPQDPAKIMFPDQN